MSKTNICIDIRMINNSGIGTYIKNFVKYLLNDDRYLVTLLGHKHDYDFYFKTDSCKFIEANFPIYSIIEQLRLPVLIPKCDLFWSPHYNVPLFPIRAKHILITIHDILHLAFYDTLTIPQKIYAKLFINTAVIKADHILTVSNYSKNEILRLTKAAPSNISIVYLGIDRSIFHPVTNFIVRQNVQKRYSLPEKYILFVGNIKPHKNLLALINAFNLLIDRLPDYQLVIVGKKEGFVIGDPNLINRIENDPNLTKRVFFTGYVNSEDLPAIYSMATVFAFPSIYEGFGIPPLEAMACGCPVVASNYASIPEICGDAANYIDPYNSYEFANSLFKIITDRSFCKFFIKKGYQRVDQFDWSISGKSLTQKINYLVDNN